MAFDHDRFIGETIGGKYRIESLLGSGGMGAVFRATQLNMDREVALKLIHGHLTRSKEAVARFRREMKATVRIRHHNTIDVYDFGETVRGELYLVMELLEGRSLAEELSGGEPMSTQRVVRIGHQVAKALGAARAEGVIHRDLKPGNIMLVDRYDERDFVKVLDFGVARLLDQEDEDPNDPITAAGSIVGTPLYMSPEQVRALPLDHRSDLYSLGVVLYQMIAAKVPFIDSMPTRVLIMHAEVPPTPPSVALGRPVAPQLQQLVLDLLAKSPDDRPQSSEDVVRRLDAVNPTGDGWRPYDSAAVTAAGLPAAPAPERERPSRGPRIALVLLVLVAVAVGVWFGLRPVDGPTRPSTDDPPADGPQAVASTTTQASDTVNATEPPTPETKDTAAPGASDPEPQTPAPDVSVATPPGPAEAPTTADVVGDTASAAADVAAAPAGAAPDVAVHAGGTAREEELRHLLDRHFTDAGEPTTPVRCRERDPATLQLLLSVALELSGGRSDSAREADRRALASLKMLTSEGIGGAEAALLLARARLYTGEGDAAAAAQRAVDLCPTHAVAYNLLGNARQRTGKLDEAEKAYESAIAEAPTYVGPRFNLGLIALARKQHARAIAIFDAVEQRAPRHDRLHLVRGHARLASGDPAGAVKDLREAVARRPRDGGALIALGHALRASGDQPAAAEVFCAAKELGVKAAAELCPAP